MADSLGQGLSDAFALAGAKGVIITARKIETLKETEANIKNANPNVEVLPLALEMTDESSVKAAFDAVKAKFGTVDVLVNNAGLSGSAGHFLRDDDMATWWADFVRSPDNCLS
jgi:NADP-dependent 3-hydroxy acid dehydrogenase YdfG